MSRISRQANTRHLSLTVFSLTVAALLACAASAPADVLKDRLRQNKAQQQHIEQRIERIDQRTQEIVASISRTNAKIAEINRPIYRLDREIADHQALIRHRQQRVVELQAEYKRQAIDIKRLAAESAVARERLAARLVVVYKQGSRSSGAWLVGASSVADVVKRQEAASQVATVDRTVLDSVRDLERRVRVERARNHQTRARIAADIAEIKREEQQVINKRAVIVSKRNELQAARNERAAYVNELKTRAAKLEEEHDDLEADSKALEQAIKNGVTTLGGSAASVPSGPSPSGVAWPVNGPVVSPFGQRWGRLHAGLDIAVPAGTPIHAAASGVVTYSSWMSGYGNLVIVQHAGSLSTAYAHQSRIGASNGQFVTQGQVIGYVGCTGHCFGDHLHFETRINGGAVDPMNYL